MDWLIFLLRTAITLTFLILAVFGPYALRKLSAFIKRYSEAHAALQQEVQVERKRIDGLIARLEQAERTLRSLQEHQQ